MAKKRRINLKVIVAAAGTGGHINPGIAIANEIKLHQPNSEIIFIGTPRGLENDLVPRAGYKLKTIDSYGISRSFTLKNIKRLFKTIGSIGDAKKIIKEFKPDIIIGTGGYICIPVCLSASSLNIPYVIHESNVMPGIATKILSKKAKKILVGFKEATERLPKEATVKLTGTPTKVKEIYISNNEKEAMKKSLGLDENKPLVLIFGGSQGAETLNKATVEIIKNRKNTNYSIMCAVGPTQYDKVSNTLKEAQVDIEKLENAKLVPYIYNMEEIMNLADLIVCRSGAMTVTEIEKLGKPAIFIPFPYAAENHQEYNARVLEKAGAAKVILDKDLNSDVLNNMVQELVKKNDNLMQMAKEAKKLSIENVEKKIYDEIITCLD